MLKDRVELSLLVALPARVGGLKRGGESRDTARAVTTDDITPGTAANAACAHLATNIGDVRDLGAIDSGN